MPPLPTKKQATAPKPTTPVPKRVPVPKLVNRGGFGLLHKRAKVKGELIPKEKHDPPKRLLLKPYIGSPRASST